MKLFIFLVLALTVFARESLLSSILEELAEETELAGVKGLGGLPQNNKVTDPLILCSYNFQLIQLLYPVGNLIDLLCFCNSFNPSILSRVVLFVTFYVNYFIIFDGSVKSSKIFNITEMSQKLKLFNTCP